jgi:ABC-type branched-subunit amino acid transport system ATPase component
MATNMLLEMPAAAVRTAKLSKDYGLGHGLFDLDLEVSPQEVFGYLGPNGAGKSTTIRCLMGSIRPTAGSAHIFGLDCQRGTAFKLYGQPLTEGVDQTRLAIMLVIVIAGFAASAIAMQRRDVGA